MSTLQDIEGLNPQFSNPDLIYPGQSVLLPDGTSHTVVPGDNLTRIANKFDKNQIERDINPGANTAGDAATGNTNSDTQDTGTDSGDHADPVTADEANNQEETEQPDAVVIGGPSYNGAGAGRGSYTGYNAADEANATPATQVAGPQAKIVTPSDNPLDNYASYTYNLTLHVLTKDDYNRMCENPYDFTPSVTLISSGSRYHNNRNPEFQTDFYFDSFKMETIVGMSSATRSSNALQFKFTIVEPYGMTLVDRLMHVNNVGLNGKNYLDMPYLLELNFFGQDDTGALGAIPTQRKWFPLKITRIKIKAGVQGATYDVDAIPFNHGANLETVQAIKTRMEITAGTVGDYFAGDITQEVNDAIQKGIDEDKERKAKIKAAQDDTKARQEAENKRASAGDTSGPAGEFDPDANPGAVRKPDTVKPTDPGVADSPISVKTKSFTAAYNAWNELERKDNTVNYSDKIAFVFMDENIKASGIVEPQKAPSRKVAETDAKANSQADSNSNTPAATADFTATVKSLEAGTAVNDIVNLVLTNSQYFYGQTKDAATQKKVLIDSGVSERDAQAIIDNTPIKFWKIIPRVTLADFDASRNKWGKLVTFYINSYLGYQKRDSRLPVSLPPGAVKRYDWLYTGKNKSVVNFDIDFNCLYYTGVNGDRGNGSAATGPAQTTDEGKNKDKKDNETSKSVDQHTSDTNSGTMQTTAGGIVQRSDSQNAASALQSIYTSSAGDMINLKLQILGDPEFLKQDDLFLNPTQVDKDDRYAGTTGSLNMDNGEIYCWVTFKTPSDFNDSTGLYDLDSKNKYVVSEFSGYYRVLKVDSEFRNGKFLQTLELVRYPKQDPVNRPAADKTASKRAGQEGATAEQLASQTSNPAISGSDLEKSTEPVTPDQTVAATEDATVVNVGTATGSDLDAAYAGDVPNTTEDEQLASVAEAPEETPIDEATSADGNTVPVQSTDVKAANDATNAQDATTQITALANANDSLRAQNEALSQQNSVLGQQGNFEQIRANNATIAQNNAIQAANGDQAFALAGKYKLDIATGTRVDGSTYIKLG